MKLIEILLGSDGETGSSSSILLLPQGMPTKTEEKREIRHCLPLHFAAQTGKYEILAVLLSRFTDVDEMIGKPIKREKKREKRKKKRKVSVKKSSKIVEKQSGEHKGLPSPPHSPHFEEEKGEKGEKSDDSPAKLEPWEGWPTSCLGMTALHIACVYQQIHCVKLLLTSSSCNPNLPLPDGKSLLSLAIEVGNLPLVDLLLSVGKVVMKAEVWKTAVETGNGSLLAHFLLAGETELPSEDKEEEKKEEEKKEEEKKEEENEKEEEGEEKEEGEGEKGKTKVCSPPNVKWEIEMAEYEELLKFLIQKQQTALFSIFIELPLSSLFGETSHSITEIGDRLELLHLACETGEAGIVTLLLNAGCSPTKVAEESGDLPAHVAARLPTADVLSLLVDAILSLNEGKKEEEEEEEEGGERKGRGKREERWKNKDKNKEIEIEKREI